MTEINLSAQTDFFNKDIDILGNQDDGGNLIKFDSTYLLPGISIDSSGNNKISLIKIDTKGNVIEKKVYGNNNDKYLLAPSESITKIAGDFYIAGDIYKDTNRVGFILKLNDQLDSVWLKYYELNDARISFISIANTPENDILIGGSKDTIGTFAYTKYYLAKLDTAGNVKWWETYDQHLNDDISSLIVSADNFYYVGGLRNAGQKRKFLAKIDTAGNEIWYKNFYNQYPEREGIYLAATVDSGLVFCSSFVYEYLNPNNYKTYGQAVKLDKFGDVEWDKKFKVPSLKKIIELQNEEFIAIGSAHLASAGGGSGGLLLKLNTYGDSIWSRNYSPVIDNYPFNILVDILEDETGNIYASGYLTPQNYDCDTLKQHSNFWVLKTDSMGCLFSGCDTVCIDFKPDFTYSQDSGYTVTFTYSGSTAMFWRWYLDDNAYHPMFAWCETAPVVSHTYPGPGQYKVLLHSQDPCGNSDTISYWITLNPVGISEKVADEFRIFPNPANNHLLVEISAQASNIEHVIEIYTVTGIQILSKLFMGKSINIDTSPLSNGMYIIYISSGAGENYKQAFIINR